MDPVYRLIPVFSPFSMTTLLVSLAQASFFLRVCAERSGPRALSVDVQNCCAVRHSRLSVRDVEREASPTAVLVIPYCVDSDGW